MLCLYRTIIVPHFIYVYKVPATNENYYMLLWCVSYLIDTNYTVVSRSPLPTLTSLLILLTYHICSGSTYSLKLKQTMVFIQTSLFPSEISEKILVEFNIQLAVHKRVTKIVNGYNEMEKYQSLNRWLSWSYGEYKWGN